MSDDAINFINYEPSAATKLEDMLKNAWANTFVAAGKKRRDGTHTEASIRSYAASHNLPVDESRLRSIFS